MVVARGQSKKNPRAPQPDASAGIQPPPMSNARRILIWAVPLAGLLLIGLAVYALRPAAPEDLERPAPLAHETVEPEKPDLPVPGTGRDVRPTPQPDTVSGGLRGRLVTSDFKPVKGQGRVEAVRGTR